MKVFTRIAALRAWLRTRRKRGPVLLVPTMGALHDGHTSLVERARRLAGRRGTVVVSVFVNPAQFGPREDLKKYPRNFPRDRLLCLRSGADAIFHPSVRALYPPGFSTWVEETELSAGLCGRSRPGHFRGVCTVVLKLLNIVGPDAAVFGRKDFQQLRVIEKMARDLDLPVRVVAAPTIREASGLARSSRNEYLSAAARQTAAALHRALQKARASARAQPVAAARLSAGIRSSLRAFRVDYIEIVNSRSLQPVKTARRGNCIAAAVFLGKVRLIDNLTI